MTPVFRLRNVNVSIGDRGAWVVEFRVRTRVVELWETTKDLADVDVVKLIESWITRGVVLPPPDGR
jgi:hypothetical protein